MSQGGTALRSFAYDAAGSVTSDTRSGTAYAYTISQAGRIAQVSVGGSVKANYLYDGRNRLSVRQTLNMTPSGTTHLIHDVWDHVLVETNGAGQAVREYIWLGDLPVAVLDGSATPTNPTLLWVHADHLGRPELLTDASKSIKWKAQYEPFGTVWSITGPAALQMRFPGQWFQIESGLAYNWWRHYDSTLGRYTQVDPMGINQGPRGPQWASTDAPPATSDGIEGYYGYAHQSPSMNTDSTGLFAVAVPAICGANPLVCAGAASAAAAAIAKICEPYLMGKKSGKEKANDIPSWAEGKKPEPGQSGRDFADKLMNDKYGKGNWKPGPGSEHNQLKKFGDRR